MKLAQAYSICERVTQRYSSSFYQAFSYLPRESRDAIWAVYAFCREIDNVVDEESVALDARRLAAARFTAHLEAAQNGRWPRHSAMWIALEDVFARYEMEWSPFFAMIEGQCEDLAFRQPETMADLERYCYLVAGTVGEMILPILAPGRGEALRGEAVKLGIAMQITNILRDVAEDLDRRRVYLPQAELARFGVTLEMLKRGVPTAEWKRMAAWLGSKAEQLYEEGMRSFALYPATSRLPLLASGEVYRAILREIERREYDVFAERVYVRDVNKRELLKPLLLKFLGRSAKAV